MNGRRPRALTPFTIVLLALGGLLLSASPAPAADRNVSAAAAQYPLAAQAPSASPPAEGGTTIPLGEEAPSTAEPIVEEILTPAVELDKPVSAGSRAGGGEFRLPFTGQLLLPLLIAGTVLLMSGLALRRVRFGRTA